MDKKKSKIVKDANKNAVFKAPTSPPTFQKESSLNNFGLQSIGLALICFIFYTNTFNNSYAVDDFLVIEKNEAINKGIAGIPELLSSDVFESYYKRNNANNRLQGGRYRPLSLITFAIEEQLFGQSMELTEENTFLANTYLIYIRHVINVLLYILSVIVLLYFLRKVVFPTQPLLAFLSVLLFAIHPIHTEVVANIKSRDELLSLLFITLTLTNAYHYLEKHKISNLLVALFCFLLALFSKEYAVSLLALIPLMFYLFKNLSIIKCLKTVLPYIAVFILYLFIRYTFVSFKGQQQDDELLNNPYFLASGTQKMATQIATLLEYLKLLLFPHPLCVDYSYNQIPYKTATDFIVWLSFFFHIFLIATLVFFIKKKNVLAFAISFYLIHLLLVSNLLFSIGATMGERLIYHSSLGFCIALAYFINWGYNKMKPSSMASSSLVAILLLIVVLAGIKTTSRNKDWESNSTLYRKDVFTAQNSAVTNANAGNAYLQLAPLQINDFEKKEMLNKAMVYLNKAINIHPGFTLAYINRGNVFFQLGNLDRAKQDWDTAKQQYPLQPELPGLFVSYYINSAVNTFGSKGNYNEAILELNKGAAINPQNVVLLYNLGYYYNMVGKKDSAITTFQKIININPNDSLAIKCASFIDILKKAPK